MRHWQLIGTLCLGAAFVFYFFPWVRVDYYKMEIDGVTAVLGLLIAGPLGVALGTKKVVVSSATQSGFSAAFLHPDHSPLAIAFVVLLVVAILIGLFTPKVVAWRIYYALVCGAAAMVLIAILAVGLPLAHATPPAGLMAEDHVTWGYLLSLAAIIGALVTRSWDMRDQGSDFASG